MGVFNRGNLIAAAIFLATMGLFSFAYYREAAPSWLLKMTSAVAYSSSTVLHAMGRSTDVVAQPQVGSRLPSYTVYGGGATLDIAIDCNGFWAFAIFIASVLAVPSTARAKLWGIALGVPALWVINTIRIVSLYFVAIYVPSVFEEVHLYVWQFLIIASAFVLLMVWAEYFTQPADA